MIPVEEDYSEKTPIYQAVLAAFIVPIFFVIFTATVKYVDQTLMLDSYDFTVGYWFILSTVLVIYNVIYVSIENDSRDYIFWI